MINLSDYKKILVIGHSLAAYALYDRIKKVSVADVEINRTPLNSSFDLVFDVDSSEPLNLSGFDYTHYIQPSHEYCFGISRTRKQLRKTDDEFLLILVDVVLSLNESKTISLSPEIMNRVKIRKMLHDEVSLEPENDF